MPRDASDLAAALAWADEHAAADAVEEWGRWGADPKAWVTLRLPAPRLHPRAPELLAAEAGASPVALRAVLERAAYIAEDGELRLWPWYPEEDATERPRAERRATELGVALPGELLDEPYQPAHYVTRSGMPAIASWLHARGVDPSVAMIDRIPLPPKKAHPDERYEGGLRATSRVNQAISSLLELVGMFRYVNDTTSEADRAELEQAMRVRLARVFSVIGNAAPPLADLDSKTEPLVEAPKLDTYVQSVPGRVRSIQALPRGGALLVCDGAFIEIDPAGAFVAAWPMMVGWPLVCGDIALVDFVAVLDLAAGRFLEAGGVLAPILARVGLPELSAITAQGHPECISACGRYRLNPPSEIVRFADGVVIAAGRDLERALALQDDDKPKRKPTGEALVAAQSLEVAPSTIIDGFRFVVRAGQAPARDGQALAFVLVDSRWRFLTGDEVREGGKTLARLGVPVCSGSFRADGAEVWALSSDHAIRVELAEVPRVATIAPLAPVLAAAARVLPPVVRDE
jgi:hypothetical protein